jgi:hypothetical protein
MTVRITFTILYALVALEAINSVRYNFKLHGVIPLSTDDVIESSRIVWEGVCVAHRPQAIAIQRCNIDSGGIMRWSLFLQNYRFRVEAMKNSANVVADYRVGSRFIPGVHYMHCAGTWTI